jgi:hypothetical protein
MAMNTLVLAKVRLDDGSQALINPDEIAFMSPHPEEGNLEQPITRVVLRSGKVLGVQGGMEGLASVFGASVNGRWE